ncbi:MAG: DUF4198 domain-containing protein [Proteobacteria bacterium]|nr:DUF4198 domain-containing protein [Pseudomonadota bacterium]
MLKNFIFLMLIVILSLSLCLDSAFGHDFWIEKKENKFLILSGHDDATEGYEPDRVKNWTVLNSKGEKININITKTKDSAHFSDSKDIGLINVFFDNKYWVKTTEGWKNIGKTEAQKKGYQILESGRSYKFAKFINKWNEKFTEPLDTKIEVIPLNNPIKSENLKIKVLLDKKPLREASIFLNASHEESLKTDKDGLANIPLKKGRNIISVTTKIPSQNDPDGDLIYLRASLSFIKE